LTKEELMGMELHSTRPLTSHIEVLKVIGGWIYTTVYADCNGDPKLISSVFVPKEAVKI